MFFNRKILMVLPLAGMLASCSMFEPGEYTPEYLKETTPLDPPGTAEARAELRKKMVKEGTYAPGDTPEVQQGKVYLFDRNPDYHPDARGRMVETATAKVIVCEGLYYFVETDGGRKGFLRESDFVSPVQLASTLPDFLPGGETPGPEGWGEGVEQPEVVQLNADQKLMTTQTGRTVVVMGKKSEKTNEFEERKKALMQGQSMPQPAAGGDELPTPASELPTPAAEL